MLNFLSVILIDFQWAKWKLDKHQFKTYYLQPFPEIFVLKNTFGPTKTSSSIFTADYIIYWSSTVNSNKDPSAL